MMRLFTCSIGFSWMVRAQFRKQVIIICLYYVILNLCRVYISLIIYKDIISVAQYILVVEKESGIIL